MIVYLDASALVPLLRKEPASPAAERLWVEADRVVSSRMLYAEARAAIARVHRQDRVDHRQRERRIGELNRLIDDIDLIDVSDPVIRHAGGLAYELALRAYDAVHLSSADLVGTTDLVFASGDKQLLQAAEALGVVTANLN